MPSTLKYSDDLISFQTITTALSVRDGQKRPLHPEIVARLQSDKALTLGIQVSPPKKKKSLEKRIDDMQNQLSMFVSIDSQEKPVHIMFFTNLSQTVTGIRNIKAAKAALKKILKVLPELEHTVPFKIRNTTIHYSLGFPLNAHDAAMVLTEQLPKDYIVMYQSDTGGKTIKVFYMAETDYSATFIIQRSGKIMQSTKDFGSRKKHFKALVDTLINNRDQIEAKD